MRENVNSEGLMGVSLVEMSIACCKWVVDAYLFARLPVAHMVPKYSRMKILFELG